MKKFQLFALSAFALFTLSACGAPKPLEAPAGKVLLTEYGDLECPACKGAKPLVEKLRAEYPDDLVFRFVHFPLSQHPNAFHAAEAAECARDQGEEKFIEFVNMTYDNQNSLNDETYKQTAEKIGLNAEKFAACLTSGDKASAVRRDMKEGTSRGVQSTPTFFLNDEKIESDRYRYEVMVKKIEELLGDETSEEETTEGNGEQM